MKQEKDVSIRTDIIPIGPTTYKAVLSIRDRWWHCNGTMTTKRQIQAMCFLWKKHSTAKRRPWKKHWLDRSKNAPPGSYEHARLGHLEMERVALRRPKMGGER